MRIKIIAYWLVVIGCVLTSCTNDIVYSRFIPMESEQWHMDSIARFDVTVTDTTVDYTAILYIRHTERYPYQNIWLFAGDSTRRDTINMFLADDRGQWRGDKKHGFIEAPVVCPPLHFADTGMYTIAVQHAMRDTLLRGITDIGLEIRQNGKK